MPKRGPQKNESRDHWMNYCMGDDEMIQEYEDTSQRATVCESYWTRVKKSEDTFVRADLNRTIVKAKANLSNQALVDELKDVLSKTWDGQARKGIIAAIGAVEKLEFPVSVDEVDLILKELGGYLGPGMQEAIREPVVEIQEASYEAGAMDITKKQGVDFAWRAPDMIALSVLNENTLFWVGDYFEDDLQGELRESLRKLYEGAYQRQEIMWDLKLALEDKLFRSDYYWDLLADHTATKIREIGRVSGYEQAGVMAVRVRARIDHKTTQICRRLHGHIIATKNLRSQVNGYLAACETKDKDKIKESWPWWNDKAAKQKLTSVEDINAHIDAGDIGLPPYHARCRTITVVEMILEPGSHDVPEKEQGLFEDGAAPIENKAKEKNGL